jgi:hypothetical protein
MRALLITILLAACSHDPLLSGALEQDCDPPRTITTDIGPSVTVLRQSNCQAKGAVCCRVSAQATHTTCQYPEDCYVAPYQGLCATPADCSDTQSCSGGACQCMLGGPPCAAPTTGVVTCCGSGQICNLGMCTAPLDGGA